MKNIPDIEIAKKMINLQQSATSRNIEFDLSFETVKHLMTRTNCYYTGVKFEDEGKLAFSVDRVDSRKGYVEGNVVSCTVDINSKKSNLSHDEIKMLYEKVKEFLAPQIAAEKKKPRRKPIKRKQNEKADISSMPNISDIVQSEEDLSIQDNEG
jgi:hypothetical protein